MDPRRTYYTRCPSEVRSTPKLCGFTVPRSIRERKTERRHTARATPAAISRLCKGERWTERSSSPTCRKFKLYHKDVEACHTHPANLTMPGAFRPRTVYTGIWRVEWYMVNVPGKSKPAKVVERGRFRHFWGVLPIVATPSTSVANTFAHRDTTDSPQPRCCRVHH